MRWSRRAVLRYAGLTGISAVVGSRLAVAQAPIDLSPLAGVLRGAKPELSGAIKIGLPVFAEAGARVPVSVTTDLPDVEAISLFVERNGEPWAATFRFERPATAHIRTQLRVESTGDVIALVKTRNPDKFFYAHADVIVNSPDGCP